MPGKNLRDLQEEINSNLNKNMSDKEIKKVSLEDEKSAVENGINSSETIEIEPKTLEEEIEANAPVIKDAKEAVFKQQEKDGQTLEINESNVPEKEEFEEGKKVILEKAKTAEEIYEESIEKLKDIPDAEDKIMLIQKENKIKIDLNIKPENRNVNP